MNKLSWLDLLGVAQAHISEICALQTPCRPRMSDIPQSSESVRITKQAVDSRAPWVTSLLRNSEDLFIIRTRGKGAHDRRLGRPHPQRGLTSFFPVKMTRILPKFMPAWCSASLANVAAILSRLASVPACKRWCNKRCLLVDKIPSNVGEVSCCREFFDLRRNFDSCQLERLQNAQCKGAPAGIRRPGGWPNYTEQNGCEAESAHLLLTSIATAAPRERSNGNTKNKSSSALYQVSACNKCAKFMT